MTLSAMTAAAARVGGVAIKTPPSSQSCRTLVPFITARNIRTTSLKSSAVTSAGGESLAANASKNRGNSHDSNSGRKLAYGAAAAGLATSAAIVKYVRDEVGGTEGLVRTASFYSLAIPKYIEYRMHMWYGSPDDVWDDLHRETSQKGLDKMLELKGFYIKSGQICASNIGNAFPRIWQDTMSVLQDQCPHKDLDTVREIIESDMNKKMEEIFSSFDPEPIGAASIGQVHRAKLIDGRPVVVKIMYPEVERIFRGDVRTIKMFAQIAQPVHVPPLIEIEKQFMKEFDYTQESAQQIKVRENLMKAGLASGPNAICTVPKAYPELCTKRVLVMDELKGEKLAVGLRKDMERHAARAGLSPEQFRQEEEKKERELKNQGLVKRGPSSEEYDKYIRILDGKRKMENAGKAAYNYTLGWLPGKEWKDYELRDTLPINHAKMVDDLIYIHGHEVLVDGYFNGDPHPGNILLMGIEEGNPHLGLIDYGQVKELTKEERLLFCKLIIALADDDKKDIIRLMKQSGYESQNMNEDIIYRFAKVSYDEDNDELTEGKHIQVFMEDLEGQDPIIHLPQQYIMIGRASVMLRGLGHALHQSRSVAKIWRPIAVRVLEEEGLL
uniref:ABC1 atypical kinase-like domain-containing protein n=1 Tax=Ditylum brightwellii TaxID=49249 RepID=A0A7S2EI95_9STRA